MLPEMVVLEPEDHASVLKSASARFGRDDRHGDAGIDAESSGKRFQQSSEMVPDPRCQLGSRSGAGRGAAALFGSPASAWSIRNALATSLDAGQTN
jgi:hypothetical protein